MKKSSILILIIICLVGCKKGSNETTITGEIKGLGTDTLYCTAWTNCTTG